MNNANNTFTIIATLTQHYPITSVISFKKHHACENFLGDQTKIWSVQAFKSTAKLPPHKKKKKRKNHNTNLFTLLTPFS